MHNLFNSDRRTLMKQAMLLMGASTLASCKGLGIGASSATLNADQLQLLDLVAETIIPETDTPGAVKAGVTKVFVHMYANWASAETREQLSGALDRIEAATRAATQKAYAELSTAQRHAMLLAHEKIALKPIPLAPGAAQGSFFAPVISVADIGYHKLKELVATLYYASEAGLTKELIYEHVPGEWQPSIKITPGMRPFATVSPF